MLETLHTQDAENQYYPWKVNQKHFRHEPPLEEDKLLMDFDATKFTPTRPKWNDASSRWKVVLMKKCVCSACQVIWYGIIAGVISAKTEPKYESLLLLRV